MTTQQVPVPRKVRPQAIYHVLMRCRETDLIRWYLKQNAGSITETAKALGVPKNFIYRRMDILGLDPAAERQRALGEEPSQNA